MSAGEHWSGEHASGELGQHLDSVRLIDHHVHGAFNTEFDRAEFEVFLNEGSPDPIPDWMTQFDSQLGFAIRRWCSPVLDLAPHASAEDYWSRRQELGLQEVTSRFLRAAGVSDWVLDTGFASDTVLDLPSMASASGGAVHEIVRLESLAEDLAARGVPGREYAEVFQSRLAEATERAVGVKTVLAYRGGFGLDLRRPEPRAVALAADRWIDSAGAGSPRLTDPVLLSFGLHAALDRGLPIQIHTGFGDRDLDLDKANPILLLDFLRTARATDVPIMLLHCYPYHREAGYLAQAFNNVYFDVGLALNYLGTRSVEVVAESLEVAPFAKQLYSSDAWGPVELHYLGAVLWRRAMKAVLGRWVQDGDWSGADAVRVVDMLARGNANRVYSLSSERRPTS
jgi:predicted TIM-barrel fold metal-dependent hydrolase